MTEPRNTTVLGIALMVGFCITGPLIDTFAKLAAAEIPVGQITLARFSVQFTLLFPLAWAMGVLHKPKPEEVGLHLIRGALICLATSCFFYALKFMPIADAMAIFFVEPLILTLMGGLFLGEPVGWRRISAAVVGFCGAMIVIRPSFAELGWVSCLPLVTAMTFAVYLLLTRSMSQRMNPMTMQAYTALASIIIVFPILLAFNDTGNIFFDMVTPTPKFWLWLALTGLFATIAHMFVSFAFSFAPATTLAPVQYLEIVGATLFGYLVFKDIPDAMTVLGVSIIVGSGYYVFHRERALARLLVTEMPPKAP